MRGALVLLYFYPLILPSIQQIFLHAFTGQAAFGGFVGAGVMQAVQLGVSRGISSNDARSHPEDSFENMAKVARHYGFPFPYLYDESHAVARAYDAHCTPDFFGFNADGLLQYRGRLDDARMGNAEGRSPELLNAMRQISRTGAGPQDQTPSMGCSIKWR